ncbi:MAG TPA: TadE/TadG family type IV pilus assembly protein [Caulobacteraceae bacterium]
MTLFRKLSGALRGFARQTRGATAVEFAIVATPFFMLLFGVMELGLLFMASTTLDAATVDAARNIRTGAMQMSGSSSAASFQADVCSHMSWLSSTDCSANVVVDVRTFATFGTIASTPPVTNGALDPTLTTYDPGTSCSIVLVRVFYPYTLYTPLVDPGLPNLGPNQHLLTSAAAFRNENYSGALPCT